MLRGVSGDDDPLPGGVRGAIQGVTSQRRGQAAVQPVLEVETRAGGPFAKPIQLERDRPMLETGMDEEPAAGVVKPGQPGQEAPMRGGHAPGNASNAAAGGSVAAWRVTLGVSMAPLPLLRQKLALFGPQRFEASAADDIVVARDGGHGIAPLGGEPEDQVKQPWNVRTVVEVVAQEGQAPSGEACATPGHDGFKPVPPPVQVRHCKPVLPAHGQRSRGSLDLLPVPHGRAPGSGQDGSAPGGAEEHPGEGSHRVAVPVDTGRFRHRRDEVLPPAHGGGNGEAQGARRAPATVAFGDSPLVKPAGEGLTDRRSEGVLVQPVQALG